jgi:hypothetical protein
MQDIHAYPFGGKECRWTNVNGWPHTSFALNKLPSHTYTHTYAYICACIHGTNTHMEDTHTHTHTHTHQLRALTDCMAHIHTGSVWTEESNICGCLEKRSGMYLLYCTASQATVKASLRFYHFNLGGLLAQADDKLKLYFDIIQD